MRRMGNRVRAGTMLILASEGVLYKGHIFPGSFYGRLRPHQSVDVDSKDENRINLSAFGLNESTFIFRYFFPESKAHYFKINFKAYYQNK